jgi:hypothetical protein
LKEIGQHMSRLKSRLEKATLMLEVES